MHTCLCVRRVKPITFIFQICSFYNIDYFPISGINVFTAKVSATKTKIKGQSYASYRLTIQKKIVEKLDLNDGDYALLFAKKASWYHLLEWDKEHFAMLPENIRLELSPSELKRGQA